MFTLICAWTHGWVNNRDDVDLRRHGAHHDVTLMMLLRIILNHSKTHPSANHLRNFWYVIKRQKAINWYKIKQNFRNIIFFEHPLLSLHWHYMKSCLLLSPATSLFGLTAKKTSRLSITGPFLYESTTARIGSVLEKYIFVPWCSVLLYSEIRLKRPPLK